MSSELIALSSGLPASGLETTENQRSLRVETRAVPLAARQWTAVAVGSLVVAGLLSLAVVIGRLPFISPLIADPLFFKRCLVVHVDLALLVWFYAFLSAMAALRSSGPNHWLSSTGLMVSVAGVTAMLAGAVVPGAQPVLANYIPVIDHPVFLVGLALFFVGVLAFLLRNLLVADATTAGGLPTDAAQGIQAAAVALVLAAATWITSFAALPKGLDTWTFFEFSAWGAGHVLQVASVCAMLAAWLWLMFRATGHQVMSARAARWWFSLLVAPHFAMPLLTVRGSLNTLYIDGATQLMTWGIFPVVTVMLFLSLRHLRRHPATEKSFITRAARAGFFASASLMILGIGLGAMIRGSTTLIPAHYHASLGAVTTSFMAAAYLMFEASAREGNQTPMIIRRLRSARRQLTCFAWGQAIFAAGFGIGGWFGLGRKAYAAEQHVRSTGEYIGLGVMGVGGLIAVVAGLWFIFLALREMRHWLNAVPLPAFSSEQPTTHHV